MIKETFQRTRGTEDPFSADARTKSISDSLTSILLYEIGYGGNIAFLEPTKVIIVTHVMGCKDTSTFEGTEEDMSLIVEAAAYSVLTNPVGEHASKEYTNAVMEQIMGVTKGNPGLLSMAGGILLGGSSLKNTLIMMCKSPEHNSELGKISNKDLMTIVIMVRLENVSIEDAIALAV